jgi:tRNA threonylcarbamoyladenosine biosynthesis protein TsaE
MENGRIFYSAVQFSSMSKTINSLDELASEATTFAHTLKPHTHMATLVTLSGELGAGKTAFTKAVAQAFGIAEVVNSPTFVLEKIYQVPTASSNAFSRLIHIDAYRLETGADLKPLAFEEFMKDSQNLIFVEWPEKVADLLPEASVRIALELLPGGSRTISYA